MNGSVELVAPEGQRCFWRNRRLRSFVSWAQCIAEFVLGNREPPKLRSSAGVCEHAEVAKSSSEVGAMMLVAQRSGPNRSCHIHFTSNRSPSTSPNTHVSPHTLLNRSSTYASTCHFAPSIATVVLSWDLAGWPRTGCGCEPVAQQSCLVRSYAGYG